MKRFALVLLLVLGSLASGCARPDESTRARVSVSTYPDPEELSPTKRWEPAREGMLMIKLVAPSEPDNKTAGNANASGPAYGVMTQPDSGEEVASGALLTLPAGAATKAYRIRLDAEGQAEFRLGEGVARLVLEVDGGAPPGAEKGCEYAPASFPTYVDVPTQDTQVEVPYRIRCLFIPDE